MTYLESGSLIQSSFQMSAASTDDLTATSWDIPTQNKLSFSEALHSQELR